MSQTTTSQQIHATPEKPITVEFLNDWWFLLLALGSVVAYLVRLEVGVNSNKESTSRIINTDLPLMRQSCSNCKAEVEMKLAANRQAFTAEIQNALVGQREFIANQIALVLEKLNTRDSQMLNLKEQTDRQGAEIRRLSNHVHEEDYKNKSND